MPIYEYVCPTCGQSFEKLVRGGRKAGQTVAACPSCGQDSHRKQVTLVAAVGSGSLTSFATSTAGCAPSG